MFVSVDATTYSSALHIARDRLDEIPQTLRTTHKLHNQRN